MSEGASADALNFVSYKRLDGVEIQYRYLFQIQIKSNQPLLRGFLVQSTDR